MILSDINSIAIINLKNASELTPLMLASSLGHTEIIHALVSVQGIKSDLRNDDRKTAHSIAFEKILKFEAIEKQRSLLPVEQKKLNEYRKCASILAGLMPYQ